MKVEKKIENELITKISEILNDFEDFEEPFVNNNYEIIIRKKFTQRRNNNSLILSNIFKQIIKNDLKKNRV